MSKALLIVSTVALGTGAGIGGLAIQFSKSESQVDYKAISNEKEEIVQESVPEERSKEESVEPVEKKCEIYSVQSSSSSNRRAKREADDFAKLNVKNADDIKKVENACNSSGKVYIARPNSKDWVYRDDDQLGNWNIEN